MHSRPYSKAETMIRRQNRRGLRSILKKHPELKFLSSESLLLVAHAFNRNMVEFLLHQGVRPHWGGGMTLAMHAASFGDVKLLRLAHQFGVDILSKNDSGETALGYAISYGEVECATVCLELGADLSDGYTEFVGGYKGEIERLRLPIQG